MSAEGEGKASKCLAWMFLPKLSSSASQVLAAAIWCNLRHKPTLDSQQWPPPLWKKRISFVKQPTPPTQSVCLSHALGCCWEDDMRDSSVYQMGSLHVCLPMAAQECTVKKKLRLSWMKTPCPHKSLLKTCPNMKCMNIFFSRHTEQLLHNGSETMWGPAWGWRPKTNLHTNGSVTGRVGPGVFLSTAISGPESPCAN